MMYACREPALSTDLFRDALERLNSLAQASSAPAKQNQINVGDAVSCMQRCVGACVYVAPSSPRPIFDDISDAQCIKICKVPKKVIADIAERGGLTADKVFMFFERCNVKIQSRVGSYHNVDQSTIWHHGKKMN